MIEWYFPASNYVRHGSGSYTVYYVKAVSVSIYYLYGSSRRTAAPTKTISGAPSATYIVYSPSVTGYTPTQSSVYDTYSNGNKYVYYYENTYSGYIANEKNPEYLPKVVISTIKAIVRESELRQSRQSYRVAVELSLLLNILAASNKFSPEDVRAMRETCEDEVKRINGTMSLDEAIRWQNS